MWKRITLILFFVFSSLCVPVKADELILPKSGTMVQLSKSFNPPILKGLKVHPDNPFRFEFILDKGDGAATEAQKLVKYFLASLTTPEQDMWVNLSPYEQNRIVPQSFGQTEMGRDLLAQDYLLKQLTSSLIYPEGETGKVFWKRIYAEAAKKFGNTNIPVNTFNKVWIVPNKAVVYENTKAGTAYVVQSSLKVLTEQDYLAQSASKHLAKTDMSAANNHILNEIVLPVLEKEINQGQNFAQLRQVYNSLILATWYKKKIKNSILNKIYINKNKVSGLSAYRSSLNAQQIYQQYLKVFKKGAYNYIKNEQDPVTQKLIPRKYFAGGVLLALKDQIESKQRIDFAQLSQQDLFEFTTDLTESTKHGIPKSFNFRELWQKKYTLYDNRLLFILRSTTYGDRPNRFLINVFDLNNKNRMSVAQLHFDLIWNTKIARMAFAAYEGFNPNEDSIYKVLNEYGFRSTDWTSYWSTINPWAFFIDKEYRNKGEEGIWNLDSILMVSALQIARINHAKRFHIFFDVENRQLDYYYKNKFGAKRRQRNVGDEDDDKGEAKIVLNGPKGNSFVQIVNGNDGKPSIFQVQQTRVQTQSRAMVSMGTIRMDDLVQALGVELRASGKQSDVYLSDQWGFVLKVFKGDVSGALKSYRLAQSRLKGLMPDFVWVKIIMLDGSKRDAVIMRRVKDNNLGRKIELLLKQGEKEAIKELMRKYVQLLFQIMRRKVLPIDALINNVGVDENGELVIVDPGLFRGLKDNKRLLNFMLTFQQNLILIKKRVAKDHAEEIIQLYKTLLIENGLGDLNRYENLNLQTFQDPDSALRELVDKIWETDNPVAMTNIASEVKDSFKGQVKIINDNASAAMMAQIKSSTGGIDFKADKINIETKISGNDNEGIQFFTDPAMLKAFEDVSGFVPLIIKEQPINDLRLFLTG